MVPHHFWKNTFLTHFLTRFWSQNDPFLKLLGPQRGQKKLITSSKWAHFTFLCTPNGPRSVLATYVFDPFLTHFWSQNGPFSRHFGILHGPNCVTTGSKQAKNTGFSIPNGPGSVLIKCIVDPFLTHLGSQNGPVSKHFGIFHGPKCATTGSKWAKNTCLSIPSGPGTTLEKIFFFAPGTLVDPPPPPPRAPPGLPSGSTK